MDYKPSLKALAAAVAFMAIVAALVVGIQRNAHRRAEDLHSEAHSVESTDGDNFITETDIAPYEAITDESEHITETATAETTTAETTTERITIAPATTAAYAEEEIREVRAVPGDYIGTFTLTAYEWTGERMANGEWPYYGACASNYFALGTVLYIDGYGTFVVKDRGGPSMGYDVIDIYLGDADACWEFGVRTAEVYYG